MVDSGVVVERLMKDRSSGMQRKCEGAMLLSSCMEELLETEDYTVGRGRV
jgi:hypothetical protein